MFYLSREIAKAHDLNQVQVLTPSQTSKMLKWESQTWIFICMSLQSKSMQFKVYFDQQSVSLFPRCDELPATLNEPFRSFLANELFWIFTSTNYVMMRVGWYKVLIFLKSAEHFSLIFFLNKLFIQTSAVVLVAFLQWTIVIHLWRLANDDNRYLPINLNT